MIPVPAKRKGLEILDLPTESYQPAELEGSLADIRIVNRYLGDRRALLKHFARLASGCSSFTLLDIATGSGDLMVDIARWARKREISAAFTGIDVNAQTVEIARVHTAGYPEINVQRADALKLPFPDRSFDFVICSKTAHHFDEEQCVRLITEMLRVARRGYLIMDLKRSWVAYFLITVLTRIFTRNRLTRYDGPLSVLKSFTEDELRNLARDAGAGSFTITREPFWLLILTGEIA